MRTLLKIIRSMITSFLCIILILGITIQLVFTIIHMQNKKIPDLIDREVLLNLITDNDSVYNDELIHPLAINYVDEYINYVFYKRSYPTLNSVLTKSYKEETSIYLQKVKDKLDIDYELVVQIRDINNFIYNSSIYLLMNISIFIIVLIISILNRSFNAGIKFLGIALIISSLITLISASILYPKMINLNDTVLSNFIAPIVNTIFISKYRKICIIYLVLGFILEIIIIIIGRNLKKDEK